MPTMTPEQRERHNEQSMRSMRRWRAAHPNDAKAACHRWYKKNAERVTAKLRARSRTLEGRAQRLLENARARSKRDGIEFAITVADIVIPSHCPLLGIPLDPAAGVRAHGLPSLDRRDNAKGYIRGNIWVISWRANNLKSDATLEELRMLVRGLETL